jgi:ABC-type antimicrobial peptide transport system permease subunit
MTVAPGIALGAAAATMVTGSMSSMLFGVGRADPLSFAACTLLFVTAAVVAAGVPARRAGQVDPLTVLRSE